MVTIPLSATRIRILKGVRFSNDYKHTRYHDTRDIQTSWFNQQSVVWQTTNSVFQRSTKETFVTVDMNIDSLWNSNYLMFQNSNTTNKWFYCFITRLEYSSQNTTKVYFELDVFQTWLYDCRILPSYVLKEHCQLYNGDKPVINTVDEGLDYGSDYQIIKTSTHKANYGIRWLVVVMKTRVDDDTAKTDRKKVYATMNGMPQPLTFYILPYNSNNPEVGVYGTFNNKSEIMSPPNSLLTGLYRYDDAVNNIVSIYVTDDIGISIGYNKVTNGSINVNYVNQYGTELSYVKFTDKDGFTFSAVRVDKINAYNRATLNTSVNKYDDFIKPSESKLLMYPYSFTQIIDNQGNTLDVKNEYLRDDEYRFSVLGSLGYSNSIGYALQNYNSDNPNNVMADLQTILYSNNPNDIPIINSRIDAYMQGNKNSLQTQKDQNIFNTVMGGLGSVASIGTSIATGNVAGAVSGGVNAVSGLGNGVLQMQALDSKVRDISNIPPDIQKQGSNSYYHNGHKLNGITIIKKQIKPEYINKLSSYFHAYGYSVKRIKQPNVHTRKDFNYIQTLECNIQADISSEDLEKMKSIFNNGITLWHNDDISNYSLENEVL